MDDGMRRDAAYRGFMHFLGPTPVAIIVQTLPSSNLESWSLQDFVGVNERVTCVSLWVVQGMEITIASP
jgi:hypothetical protein